MKLKLENYVDYSPHLEALNSAMGALESLQLEYNRHGWIKESKNLDKLIQGLEKEFNDITDFEEERNKEENE